MEGENKNVLYIIVAVIVVALIGWWLYAGNSQGSETSLEAPPVVVTEDPKLQADQVLGSKELSGSQADAIAQNKASILLTVRSGKTLTPKERSEIGNIMLTQAHLYKFSPDESQEIFDALGR